jgi:alkylation response protein AidB-like acyl-CoA dehydrogenase
MTMRAFLDEELLMLRDGARTWVRDNWPVKMGRDRTLGDAHKDLAIYSKIAQLGWTGLLVPEDHGGSPMGYAGMGVVLEELGRHIVPSPFLGSAVGATVAIARSANETLRRTYLPQLASGGLVGTLAIDDAPGCVPLEAMHHGAGWILNGMKRPILFGSVADIVIVDACVSSETGTGSERALFVVDAATAGIRRRALRQIDSQDAAEYEFSSVTVDEHRMLTPFGHDEGLRSRILDGVRAGLAAEMLGMASQAFETTLDYLKVRKQFDSVIGSFQALQHRAAHMYGELEMTRTTVEEALFALDDDSDEVAKAVSVAKAMAGETLQLVCNEMVQMHGGIAMTDEHDAGIYLKRARVAEAMFGNAGFHRERFGRLIGY